MTSQDNPNSIILMSLGISLTFGLTIVSTMLQTNQNARDPTDPGNTLVNVYITMENHGKSPFLMGKFTISTGPFSIAILT